MPDQGWKLHISANSGSAEAVLRRVLPILLAERVHFKVASSLRHLTRLNKGEWGASQVGKFITIYPTNDDEAVRLAVRLDELTRGLSGPRVPSDRALHAASLIHYRYGSFRARSYRQAPGGWIETTLQTPDNREVPDQRKPRYEAPEWVIDPFVAANISADLPVFERIIGERYLIVSTVFASVNHIIYLGADLEKGRLCIIKSPGYAWLNNLTDRRMHQQLCHEADILGRLAPNPHIPALFDVVEQHDTISLIMEDIEGENLSVHVSQALHQGKYVQIQQVITWGIELAEILESIHARGFVYGDTKSSNVIVDRDGHLHLIDFELACAQDQSGCDQAQCSGHGTLGYMSPQQWRRLPLTISDDIYGFGALLYFLVTGAEPSQAPNYRALLERHLEWLRPEAEAIYFKHIIEYCLQEKPEARYASMSQVKAALTAIQEIVRHRDSWQIDIEDVMHIEEKEIATNREPREHYRELSKRLMETICIQARPTRDKRGRAWISTHTLTHGLLSRDINTGNAGTILALAELVAAHVDTRSKDILEAASHWLCHTSPLGTPPLPGLYVGEAGVGAALLRAGQIIHNERLIEAALQQGRLIASLPHVSPDLFNGTAGRLRYHLLLWDETGEREQLCHAFQCGEQLLKMAIETDKREAFWYIPEGYGDLSGVAQPGYAHGAAGIADALLDLYTVSGDKRFLALIRRAASWLQRQAIPVLDDASGLSWPREAGGKCHPSYWCHGGAGIGRFFLHCAEYDLLPEAGDIAARTAHTVALTTRWSGPTQCHGLAGNCEFLLDMYQATGEHTYLADAFLFGNLLETFAQEQHGYLVFPSDLPATFTPDYMVGYAGIALCLLRLSCPEDLPHQLSRAGFRVHAPIEEVSTCVSIPQSGWKGTWF
jgi:serine/threonine protein kinase